MEKFYALVPNVSIASGTLGWLTNDISIDDINGYEVTLVFMIIFIWDDVAIDDYVNMSCCCRWWLC